jgi:hypothetical protein
MFYFIVIGRNEQGQGIKSMLDSFLLGNVLKNLSIFLSNAHEISVEAT